MYQKKSYGSHTSKVTLGDLVAEEPCYGTSATAIARTDDKQPKYIRITDFDDFGIDDNHEYMTAEKYADKHILKNGDILFARTGATVGKTYYYDGSIGNAVFAGYCIRFRFDEKKVFPKFVYWCTKTSSFINWVNGIQRPSGQPNINKEEYKSYVINLPNMEIQKSLSDYLDNALSIRNQKINKLNEYVDITRKQLFHQLNIDFIEYTPHLFSFTKLADVKKLGIYCNPHSAYLRKVFLQLSNHSWYHGVLKDFVDINPPIDKTELTNETKVSFVPMTNVGEKNNKVLYEIKDYQEVKTGFTPFMKGDLLWAKITPCMQNGKSFIADNMPTKHGFGSTEFHVLRLKNENLYLPYLWVILSDSNILEAAQGMFSGSAGQQRVTDVFLENFPVVLPPYNLQIELADKVFSSLQEADVLTQQAEQEWQEAKKQFENELLGE